MAHVISLRREKVIVTADRVERFAPLEKAPPKALELRLAQLRSFSIQAGGAGAIACAKFAQRVRRHGKLRLFRIFKLFGPLKLLNAELVYRPLGERLRAVRWMRRL